MRPASAQLADGTALDYDMLLLSTGATHAYFVHYEGLRTHGPEDPTTRWKSAAASSPVERAEPNPDPYCARPG